MNPDQNFLNNLELLWQAQPVPAAPQPPQDKPHVWHYAASVVAMLLVAATLAACTPRLDADAIDIHSITRHVQVTETVTSILANK